MTLPEEERDMKSLEVETTRLISDKSGGVRHERPNVDEIIAASGISERLWRLYAYFWLICLVFPIFSLIQTPRREMTLLPATLGLVLFTATYFWVMWTHPLKDQARTRIGLRASLTIITGLTVLVFALSMVYNSSFL